MKNGSRINSGKEEEEEEGETWHQPPKGEKRKKIEAL